MAIKRPLNALLMLSDDRALIIKHGKGKKMVCRQKAIKGCNSTPLKKGEHVKTKPGRDGRCNVLRVVKLTRKDVHFYIEGTCDA